jgi:hypothetical protein
MCKLRLYRDLEHRDEARFNRLPEHEKVNADQCATGGIDQHRSAL